jgi:hypothetical protein
MNNCPVCDDGKLITKISSAGEETFCNDCRRIIASATLGFVFTAASDEKGVEDCKGPENDPRPGFKGPGKRAKCHLYDPGDERQKERAYQRAKNSAYSSQTRVVISRVINGTGGFTLTDPGRNLIGDPRETSPTTLQSSGGGATTAAEHGAMDISNATAPNGVQPNSNLNSANPLNSGTTASKKVLALLSEFDRNNMDIRDYMGPAVCTSCNEQHGDDECKRPNKPY